MYVVFEFYTSDDEILTVDGEYTPEEPANLFCLPENAHDGSDAYFEAEKITFEDGRKFEGELDQDTLLEAASERACEMIDY